LRVWVGEKDTLTHTLTLTLKGIGEMTVDER
jgi:hypothetical protein